MDSITQIVLGAACGEAVLGKKIGNKALLFGAIGGTIPDLDVLVGSWIFNNEIDAMLFHRGFMHSILISVLGAFLFGWMAFKLYNTGKRFETTTQHNWIALFFWSLFTHPILDSFTPYGTQLFAPFSNYRVAFNNIAVADPLYTLPFLICILLILFFKRTSKQRRLWLKLGVGISSAYMLFTIGNKLYMDSVFRESLIDRQIQFTRFSSQPTILNNILWYGIAETETDYQVGFYSLFDNSNRFSEWHTLPKSREIKVEDFDDLKDLAWFSNNYFSVVETNNNEYDYKDLRYPLIKTKNGYESVFGLALFEEDNRLNMRQFEPKVDDFGQAMSELWKRIQGI